MLNVLVTEIVLQRARIYILTNRTTTAGKFAWGSSNAGNSSFDFLRPHALNFTTSGVLSASTTLTSAQGQWIGIRSSDVQLDVYQNGTTTPVVSNGAATSVSLTDNSLLFFARRTSGAPTGFTDDQMSAGFFGAGL